MKAFNTLAVAACALNFTIMVSLGNYLLDIYKPYAIIVYVCSTPSFVLMVILLDKISYKGKG